MAFTDTTMFFNQNISHRHHCLFEQKGAFLCFRKYNNRGSADCSYVFSGNYCALTQRSTVQAYEAECSRREDGGQRSIYEAGSHSGRD